jgi:hypothetical protein
MEFKIIELAKAVREICFKHNPDSPLAVETFVDYAEIDGFPHDLIQKTVADFFRAA